MKKLALSAIVVAFVFFASMAIVSCEVGETDTAAVFYPENNAEDAGVETNDADAEPEDAETSVDCGPPVDADVSSDIPAMHCGEPTP